MKSFAALLALVSASAPGIFGASTRDASPSLITIAYAADNQFAPAVMEAMQKELAQVLNLPGGPPDWMKVTTVQRTGVDNRLVVVTFKGACEASLPPIGVEPDGILGDSAVVDGIVLPFATVECNRVRSLLGRTLSLPERRSSEVFGRALGRILAHEVYHIIAGTTRHTRSGITKRRFNAADLTDLRLRMPLKAQLAITRGLPRRCVVAGPPPAAAMSESGIQ